MYRELSETSKTGFFSKIVDCIQPFTIFAKHFILGVSKGYECASDKTNEKTGALSFIS